MYSHKVRMTVQVLRKKIKGSVLGALVGDCIGAPFEGEESKVALSVLKNYFIKLKDTSVTLPFYSFTDDTAMTAALIESILSQGGFQATPTAKKFTTNYFKDPRRGYGKNVVTVFQKLKSTKYSDPFLPAQEQFNGCGSYGNGAAMRVAPIALFYHNHQDNMLEYAKLSALITHSHPEGVLGAILQSLAVSEALRLNKGEFDANNYVDILTEKMFTIEKQYMGSEGDVSILTFTEKLKRLKTLLEKPLESAEDDVLEYLGNDISAAGSVPTAIYSFARSEMGKGLCDDQVENSFEEAIKLSIRLGGDTDTIATMAGAISGAYHGEDAINSTLLSRCEDHDKMTRLADDLADCMPS